MIEAIHNSQELFFRNPFGAVEENKAIALRILVKCENVKAVYVRLWHDSYENKVIMKKERCQEGYDLYSAAISSGPCGLLWYYFIIEIEDGTWYYCNNDLNLGGEGVLKDKPLNSYQITVYKKDFKTPDWFKEGIIYQIFVDRFYNGNEDGSVNTRSDEYTLHSSWDEVPEYKPDYTGIYRVNDFYGGNLKGIINKLPYLKDLGISVIYLNPIFKAFSNHKYDTGSYEQVDPMYGDIGIFKELCQTAGKMGIKIILDGVFSHTGSNSRYFNKYGTYDSVGAYQSKQSPYYSWYSFKCFPDQYSCWWNFDTLPNVDEENPSYKDYILTGRDSIIKRWLKYGASGWRLDVADELPESFLKTLRTSAKSQYKDAVIIGEVWEDASNKLSYGCPRQYLCGDELDTAMNYPFRSIVIDFLTNKCSAEQLRAKVMSLKENYPSQSFYAAMNLIGSHDVPRILTVLGDAPDNDSLSMEEKASYKLPKDKRALGERRLKLAAVMQMTFPGVPSIYYGDEAGVEGYRDPFNRGTYPWGSESEDLMECHKNLTHLRSSTDALRTGEFKQLYASGDVYGYVRYIEDGTNVFGEKRDNGFVMVLINRSINESRHPIVDLSSYKNIKKLVNYYTGEVIAPSALAHIEILPLSASIFIGR